MPEPQTLDPYEIDESKPITIAPREWFFFKEEIKTQVAEGKGIDILKALHNARYWAEIDRRFDKVEAGRWTEHELIEANANE